jgi:hypothetical protein
MVPHNAFSPRANEPFGPGCDIFDVRVSQKPKWAARGRNRLPEGSGGSISVTGVAEYDAFGRVLD